MRTISRALQITKSLLLTHKYLHSTFLETSVLNMQTSSPVTIHMTLIFKLIKSNN